MKCIRAKSIFQVYDYDGNLTLKIDENSIGKYICRASVKGFREISATAEVFMRGPPRILNNQALFYGRVGSNVELICEAFGIPPPSTIHWSNFGFSLPINNGAHDHFRLIEQQRKDGFKSKLIIRPVTQADFGDYNCTVQNSHGVDSYVITLKEERKFILKSFLKNPTNLQFVDSEPPLDNDTVSGDWWCCINCGRHFVDDFMPPFLSSNFESFEWSSAKWRK